MLKQGEMEEVESKDPKTGLTIRISTTTRLVYRHMYPEQYGDLRNIRLNDVIAKQFSGSDVVHYFRLGTGSEKGTGHGGVAEIRYGPSGIYYISAIRQNSIDILTVQSDWLKPKYKGSAERPMEMGDE
jgi:hypothetical protein